MMKVDITGGSYEVLQWPLIMLDLCLLITYDDINHMNTPCEINASTNQCF